MKTTDITGSLAALRTKRTLPSNPREYEGKNDHKVEKSEEGKKLHLSSSASVRSVRSVDNAHGLPADQAAWLPIAKQVLAGEFDGADRSTRESVMIGFRSIQHPDCRYALERLRATKL